MTMLNQDTARKLVDRLAVGSPVERPGRPLVAALRAYQQADAEGVMVLVSRQACEEAAAEMERAWAARDAAVADLEAYAEAEVSRAVAAERERWRTAALAGCDGTHPKYAEALRNLVVMLDAGVA